MSVVDPMTAINLGYINSAIATGRPELLKPVLVHVDRADLAKRVQRELVKMLQALITQSERDKRLHQLMRERMDSLTDNLSGAHAMAEGMQEWLDEQLDVHGFARLDDVDYTGVRA